MSGHAIASMVVTLRHSLPGQTQCPTWQTIPFSLGITLLELTGLFRLLRYAHCAPVLALY